MLSWISRSNRFGLRMCGLLWIILPRIAISSDLQTLRLGSTKVESGPTKPLHLSADQLNYQQSQGKIELQGRVALVMGQLTLTARQMVVFLDPKGQPTRFQAQGNVAFTIGRNQGRAEEAFIFSKGNNIELMGKVELHMSQLGLDLQGHRIQLNIESGRLTVHSAKARLHSLASHGR